MTNIIVDAFGGDKAPAVVLKASRRAADQFADTTKIILCGNKEELLKCAKAERCSLSGLEILEAPAVFDMNFDPLSITKEHSDTSLAVGLQSLAAGAAQAFVSAGSTGALIAGATLIVKRIQGVRRAAIGVVLPTLQKNPFLLLDSGANSECSVEMLENFALIGSIYMQDVLGLPLPRVGLVNIGTEEHKGDALRQETFQRLQANQRIHFLGNIEARELPLGGCDVAVTDGFTGNMLLKLFEGMGKMMTGQLKRLFLRNPLGWVSAVFGAPGLLRLKKDLDYQRFGGAPLLGIQKVIIKAHGSSGEKALFHAIRQARECVENRVVEKIQEKIK